MRSQTKKDLDKGEKCQWVIISPAVSCLSVFLKTSDAQP